MLLLNDSSNLLAIYLQQQIRQCAVVVAHFLHHLLTRHLGIMFQLKKITSELCRVPVIILCSSLFIFPFAHAELKADHDLDGISDDLDNCPFFSNPGQWDKDKDGVGNECDSDIDGDGYSNEKEKASGSKIWDPLSYPAVGTNLDQDNDGIRDAIDNCPFIANPGQWDKDKDSIGNECDLDIDGDGFSNEQEKLALTKVWDNRSFPDIKQNLDDIDGDGVIDDKDNCPHRANAGQWDKDKDGIGNKCDADIDGDGFSNDDELAANTKLWDASSYPDIAPELTCDGERISLNKRKTLKASNFNDDSQRLVSIDPQTGSLNYQAYSNHLQTNVVHILPDFSHAGYQGGGVALPIYDQLPVVKILHASGGDDYSAIQVAIDEASLLPANEEGIRGVVLLKQGTYLVSQSIKIHTSGVILRGEGQGVDGTVIRATTTETKATLIEILGEGSGLRPRSASNKALTRIKTDYLAVGAQSFDVDSADGYAVCDKVAIVRTPNDNWLGENGVNMAQYGWTKSGYTISAQARVIAIEDNRITIDIPIMDAIEQQFGGGEIYRTDTSQRLQLVAVENLRLQTLDLDTNNDNRASTAIAVKEVENAWFRDISLEFFSMGIVFKDGTRNNTAQDIAYLSPDFKVAGGYGYAFYIEGGHGNLFQRTYADSARHTFVTGSGVMGPNVFLDSVAVNAQNDSGPHHRWATGTLYDNTKGELLRAQNRTISGTGHGWAGAQQMFWHTQHNAYVVQAPPMAMNWSVGADGEFKKGYWSPDEKDGLIIPFEASIHPRSLYLQQLQDRLGEQAVLNVTTPAQLNGRIWHQLEQWQGQSKHNMQ